MSLDISFSEELKCPDCDKVITTFEVYSTNITHNLIRMASQIGVYNCLWCPEDVGINRAKDMITTLQDGIKRMVKEPEICRSFDSPNGWGTYDDFLPWLCDILQACETYPDSIISISK